ncbi:MULTISPECIES: DUF4148 domain-containing protein [Caballeronia]|jgi:hypothetical protein|uniref:Purine nucleoside phosphorylase n=1 Tax=Caballeronia zhejiangensis TaxID=871203 RepID=A0A656QIW6_9BURK|nr:MULTISPECIES: DUF4148 domain-containing protein [Caballeronia]EKS70104.1 hypothetical protein BURK_018540 [Burkholderia sp. SJ98]KDR27506.1 hypothetical protein BG60_16795 [Caballeronia zhejiangensis]MCG7400863.1 DUF4148 domain-containing protein [Caballeronia zhejiangensis]MCI1043370.1 DUF4148 domain-containing protein [Caballeronia zhejiangensis]MDR5767711.1 DUF4148 domain-containing protein [Caballeronia sp. LZ028]
MKVIQSLIVAAAVALPVLSFAQSNQPITRAEVRAQLVELEKAGYDPASDQTQYPQNIQAAQARVDAAKGLTAYGAPANGNVASGTRSADTDVIGLGPVFAKP